MFGNNDLFSGTELVDVLAQLIFEFANTDVNAVVVRCRVNNKMVARIKFICGYKLSRGASHWDDFDQFFYPLEVIRISRE